MECFDKRLVMKFGKNMNKSLILHLETNPKDYLKQKK